MKSKTIGLFCSILLLLACETELPEPLTYGSVHGHVRSGLSAEPMDSILVKLMDLSITIDTIAYDNGSAFLDSTFTDSLGYYAFDSLQPGKYGVMPIHGSMDFRASDNSDSLEFEITAEETFEVNFEAAPLLFGGGNFHIELKFINLPGTQEYKSLYCHVFRRHWVLFIPFMQTNGLHIRAHDQTWEGKNRFLMEFPWHYVYTLWSMDNLLGFQITPSYDQEADLSKVDFWIYTPIDQTPPTRTYEVDFTTMIPVLKD